MNIRAKKPKYKVGDKVYSYANRDKKASINYVHISPAGYPHKYRLTYRGDDGYPHNSNWIDEGSLSRTKSRV